MLVEQHAFIQVSSDFRVCKTSLNLPDSCPIVKNQPYVSMGHVLSLHKTITCVLEFKNPPKILVCHCFRCKSVMSQSIGHQNLRWNIAMLLNFHSVMLFIL